VDGKVAVQRRVKEKTGESEREGSPQPGKMINPSAGNELPKKKDNGRESKEGGY